MYLCMYVCMYVMYVCPSYVGPCPHGMARSWVIDGGDDFQIWRVAENVSNKQLRIADTGCSSIWMGGQGANNSSP
jgi:hypothetical protein